MAWGQGSASGRDGGMRSDGAAEGRGGGREPSQQLEQLM